MVKSDPGNNISLLWQRCDPCCRKSVTETLTQLGAAPRKRWGQNFLLDLRAQQRIVAAAAIEPTDNIWEIGPGLGALTQHFWRRGSTLTLFEIDPILLQFYRDTSSRACEASLKNAETRCQLIAGDVIKTWPQVRPYPDVVISNLPYNSASLLIGKFAQNIDFRPRCMVFTIQKEMAARLMATERSKPYSSFSVLLQSQFYIELLFDLSAQLFYPSPNVTSTTIRLKPRQHGLGQLQIKELECFTRTIFRQRRKTIANNIRASHYQSRFGELELKLNRIGIRCHQRAEEISVAQFLALGQKLAPELE